MAYTLLNGADRVVEQGTSGRWHYRKWSSGLAECWGTHACTGMNLTTQGAGTYYSSTSATINLPSGLFKTVDNAFAQASQVPYVSGHSGAIFVYNISGATTSKVDVQHRSFTSIQNGACDTFVQVWGKWK